MMVPGWRTESTLLHSGKVARLVYLQGLPSMQLVADSLTWASGG